MLKLVLLFFGGLIMSAGCAWLLTLELGGGLGAWKAMLAGYVGAPFFLLCALIGLQRLLSVRAPVVTITPSGITDTRVASGEIPWAAVEDISSWSHRGQKFLVLKVAPAVESQLGLTTVAKWTRRTNAALGADGLCIGAQGLKTTHQVLSDAILAYARAAHGSASH